MGTFIIKPTGIGTKNGFWFSWDGASTFSTSDANLISGINNPATTILNLHLTGALSLYGGTDVTHGAASNTNDLLRFTFGGACIYLDGSSTPIALNDLPAGFLITAAKVRMRSQNGGSDATYHVQLQFDALTESGNLAPLPLLTGSPFEYIYPATLPTMLALYTGGFGLRINNTTVGQQSIREYVGGYISGTYGIVNATWNLEQGQQPVQAGDSITITSANPNALQFDHLTDIDIVFNDENDVLRTIPVTVISTQTGFLLVFIWPSFGAFTPGTAEVIATGDGTQFSGSISLGKLSTIFFENAPGIYRITANKTNDTLYDVLNGGTIDVKIPNPFAKTGFIGG